MSKDVLRKAAPVKPSVESAISDIRKAITVSVSGFFVPMDIAGTGGCKLTLGTDDTVNHEARLSQLGPLLAAEGGYVDLRTLFTGERDQLNVRELGKALRSLVLEGIITVYEETCQGVDVAVIHASYRDAWYEPA